MTTPHFSLAQIIIENAKLDAIIQDHPTEAGYRDTFASLTLPANDYRTHQDEITLFFEETLSNGARSFVTFDPTGTDVTVHIDHYSYLHDIHPTLQLSVEDKQTEARMLYAKESERTREEDVDTGIEIIAINRFAADIATIGGKTGSYAVIDIESASDNTRQLIEGALNHRGVTEISWQPSDQGAKLFIRSQDYIQKLLPDMHLKPDDRHRETMTLEVNRLTVEREALMAGR